MKMPAHPGGPRLPVDHPPASTTTWTRRRIPPIESDANETAPVWPDRKHIPRTLRLHFSEHRSQASILSLDKAGLDGLDISPRSLRARRTSVARYLFRSRTRSQARYQTSEHHPSGIGREMAPEWLRENKARCRC